MKNLYLYINESILDNEEDIMSTAEDRIKTVKKYGSVPVYNISMTAQYIVDNLKKKLNIKWEKEPVKAKAFKTKFDIYSFKIPIERWVKDGYEIVEKVLMSARQLPELIKDEKLNYECLMEDFVDESTGYVVPCLRVSCDDGGKLIDGSAVFTVDDIDDAQGDEDSDYLKLVVLGKYIKI